MVNHSATAAMAGHRLPKYQDVGSGAGELRDAWPHAPKPLLPPTSLPERSCSSPPEGGCGAVFLPSAANHRSTVALQQGCGMHAIAVRRSCSRLRFQMGSLRALHA